MREIKFRAWDRNKSKFGEVVAIDFTANKVELSYFDDLKTEELDEVILMQYTGLSDKNGKEIYEGDIVKSFKYEIDKMYNIGTENQFATQKKSDHNYVVTWDERDARFKMSDSTIIPMSFALEVIGNIYENPELIR